MAEVYSNPIATRLGLNKDDQKREAKLLRLCEDLQEKILTPITMDIEWRYSEEKMTAQAALDADWSGWDVFDARTVWGRPQANTWIVADVTVPEAASGQVFLLKFSSNWLPRPGGTDPQGLIYVNGDIVQGLDGNHTEIVLARDAVPGASFKVAIDAFTFFERLLVGLDAKPMLRNEGVEQVYFDIKTPLDIAVLLQQNDVRRHKVLDLVEEALHTLDLRQPGATLDVAEAKEVAARIYEIKDTEARPIVTAVGHTHIDVGWLWRVLHTREKSGRSFSTVLKLMEEFPEYIFMYNQAVLFDYLKDDYPDIWNGILEKVKTGQFEIEGAMWLEPDANIISGESMVRQIMMGRAFHQDNFGITPTCVWLPDTFGYSANMPQVLEGCGLEHFITSKISWNDTDKFPFDAFFWHGIDGTAIKARLITTQEYESDDIFTTYNSILSASEVMGSWRRQEPKAASQDVLICYGFGDGGGGPTREMVQQGMRFAKGIAGAPEVRMEGLGKFLERSSSSMNEEPEKFPSWHGELYLQLHRGTLTTVAKNKANNRQAERQVRELEFLSSLGVLNGHAYPVEVLDAHWKTILLNQFHDILPGTSIDEVYVDSDEEYGALFADMANGNGSWHTAARASIGADNGAQVLNFTSQQRNDLVSLGQDWEGKSLVNGDASSPVQRLHRADGSEEWAAKSGPVPSLGWAGAGQSSEAQSESRSLTVQTDLLENDHLRMRLNDKGEITSLYDKDSDRELIPEGETANQLIAYEDKPANWDAWDIDWSFEHKFWPLSDCPVIVEVVETGPLRAALKISWDYQSSRVVQVISLEKDARQVEFDTFIDWHETRTVLKAGFPFDLNSTDLSAEIQFGHVTRKTHRNTSWDKAQHEASMHRWVSIAERDFGAALLNDCKYGYDAVDQLIRLTLVRAPEWPNPKADRGEHRLKYAVMLHDGEISTVHRAAERFNNPLALVGTPMEQAGSSFSFAQIDVPNVTIETVKKAEAGDDLIVRIFEHANRRAKATITFDLPFESIERVNLVEETLGEVDTRDNKVTLDLRPFEIVTLRLKGMGAIA